MTDRYEIARDFLLQHFTVEELPEVMAAVLRKTSRCLWRVTAHGRGTASSSIGIATTREVGRSIALRWLMPTSKTIAWDEERGDEDQYGRHGDFTLVVSRVFIDHAPIETPPRTSPPTE